jgi:hypothetical protein
MKKIDFRLLKPHLTAAGLFLAICLLYFSPLLGGKKLRQNDIIQYKGVSKEINDFRERTGQEALWTNSLFGGMPAYQISVLHPGNLLKKVDRLFQLYLPHPANVVFLCLIGFYFLLITLGAEFRLAIIGAIIYTLSSYFFIIIEAGHNTKAHAMCYVAPVIAGVLMTYRRDMLKGGILTSLFLGLEILTNHLQITYYLALMIFLLMGFQLYISIKNQELGRFIKASFVLLAACILAIGANIGNLWTTFEYTQFSTRGQSELSAKKVSTGLDKDYALGWSYGIAETMTLLIPNFMGGSSGGELSTASNTYKALQQNGVGTQQSKQFIKNAPLYWGDQPFTSGPVYFGAVAVFLFILGLWLQKGPLKWWIVSITVLSLLLSWGRNIEFFTDIVFDYLPGYNKFRTVSMSLVIAQFGVAVLAFLGLKSFFEKNQLSDGEKKRSLLRSFYISAGICLFFALLGPALFNFTSPEDKTNQLPDWVMEAVRADREMLLRMDSLRSLFFIGISFMFLFLSLRNRIRREYVLWAIAGVCLLDLWLVDKRYLSSDNFTSAREVQEPFQPTQADLAILQDKDPNFRVLNLSVNTFNDASTSYFHKSIGGYHGAKPKRYQEIIETHISRNNMAVLNMLNTKYFIVPSRAEGGGEPVAQRNPDALGSVWFVREYKLVANADSELNALSDFDPSKTVIIDQRFGDHTRGLSLNYDSAAAIKLTSYEPNHLKYESSAASEQFAVFSEIYYDKGWKTFIDGKEAAHIRVNYLLRGMRVPAGKHTIEFKFEPESYRTGNKISLASSGAIILMLLLVLVREIRKLQA